MLSDYFRSAHQRTSTVTFLGASEINKAYNTVNMSSKCSYFFFGVIKWVKFNFKPGFSSLKPLSGEWMNIPGGLSFPTLFKINYLAIFSANLVKTAVASHSLLWKY